MDEGRLEALDGIRAKLELIRGVEAERGFGVVIEGGGELERIPELPEGVTEVFSLFHRLRGDCFSFSRPEEIASRDAWAARWLNPHCPLNNPLVIGLERYGAPADIEGGAPVYLDLEAGDVYYCDPDEYVFAYKHPYDVTEVEVTDLAPDIVTFFDVHVLGEGYPHLVRAIHGERPLLHDRRGRPRDRWMRLLAASGLA